MPGAAALQVKAAAQSGELRKRMRGGRLPRPPAAIYPHRIEQAYARDILRLLAPARELVEQHVISELPAIVAAAGLAPEPTRTDDDYAQRISRTFDWVTVVYRRSVPEEDVEQTARGTGQDVERHNAIQVDAQAKAVLGFDVITAEPWLQPAVSSFTRENIALIKSIPDRYFAEIEALVQRSVRSGKRASDIADEIHQRYSVAESRAMLIARDQVAKFNGELTRHRHADLGVTRYRWRCSMDERVRGNPAGLYPSARPSHFDREGKIFEYEKAPSGGNPGEPIQCRCWAEPVFEDLLGEAAAVDLSPAPVSTTYLPLADVRTLRAVPSGPAAINASMTLAQAEDVIRHKPVEHIGVYGGGTKLLHTGSGTADSVPVPHAVMAEMRRRANVVVTHNHPCNLPLSPQDVAIAITANTQETRATIPTGGAWVIRRPPGGWRTRLPHDVLVKELTTVYDRVATEAISRVGSRSYANKKTKEAALQRYIRREVPRAYADWASQRGYTWRIEREDRRRRRRRPPTAS